MLIYIRINISDCFKNRWEGIEMLATETEEDNEAEQQGMKWDFKRTGKRLGWILNIYYMKAIL